MVKYKVRITVDCDVHINPVELHKFLKLAEDEPLDEKAVLAVIDDQLEVTADCFPRNEERLRVRKAHVTLVEFLK